MSIKNFPVRKGIGSREILMIKKCINYYKKKNTDIGYNGFYEKLYCKKFVQFLGTKGYADVQATGTLALYSSILAFSLKKKSEVLLSPITDPGTLSAIILAGLTPRLLDVKKNSYLIDLENLKKRVSKKTKLLVLVHAAGKSVEMAEILKFCKKKKIFILEDCSQAHGAKCSFCKNCKCEKKVGTFGDISAFSTMNRKVHMTGPTGGVVFSKKKYLMNLVKAHADRGKPIWKKNFNERNPKSFLFPALNLHSNEISCSIGISSLKRLSWTIKKRLKFCSQLEKLLMDKSKLCRSMSFNKNDSPFFIPIFFKKNKKISKLQFAIKLKKLGVDLNVHYDYLISDWPWAKKYLSDSFIPKNAKVTLDNCFNIYLNENYKFKHANFIVNQILKLEKKYGF